MAEFDELTVKPYRKRVNNWSNTLACYPELIFEPTSAAEVQTIINEARKRGCRIRPVGEHASPGKAFTAGKDDVRCILWALIRRLL
jgi:FAD/FMN-containing dehydrogenase